MRNLIYQAEIGDGSRVPHIDVLTASVSRYAKSLDTEYIFHREEVSSEYLIEMFYTSLNIIYDETFDQYDDILFLDTDIYVSETAKNIFAIKKPINTDLLATSVLYYHDVYPQYAQQSNLVRSTRFSDPRYINSGVILFTKKGRLKARRTWEDWKPFIKAFGHGFHDELFINHMINKYNFNVKELSSAWNFLYNYDKAEERNPHFFHFPGVKKRFIEGFLKKKGEI